MLSIFGEQFKEGAIVLMIISVGQFVNVAMVSVGNLLMMTVHECLLRTESYFSAFTGILSSVWLISCDGIVGVAVSTVFTLSIQNLIAVVQVRMKLEIYAISMGKKCVRRICCIAIIYNLFFAVRGG